MAATLDAAYQNNAFNSEIHNEISPTFDKHIGKETIIEMGDGDTLQTQMSVEGARVIADLSPRITVTFNKVSKVISVPAKMIDPTSKERFITRTLLDNVSGQIHPGQIVALMGPSGNQNIHTHLVSLDIIVFNRMWKNNITQYISWSSFEWCHWRYLVQ
jgi:ABC-type multidrug transport system fused ATPase/permease subunit